MTTELEIRPLSLLDVPSLLLIEASQPDPWTEKILEDCLRVPYENFGIFSGEVLLGFIIFQYILEEAHLLNFGVSPSFRRQGIGKKLLQFFMDQGKKRGKTIFYLEVRISNLPAIRLYERAGFSIIGRRKDYYRTPVGTEDALVFSRNDGHPVRT